MNLLLSMFLATLPTVVHPVKDPATEQMLRTIVEEPDPVIRREARDALEAVRTGVVTNAPAVVPPMPMVLLEHPAVILTRMNPMEIRERADWVQEHLAAAEITTVEAAVEAARRGELVSAMPRLVPLLENPDEGLRQAVCQALQRLAQQTNDVTVVTAIGQLLDGEVSTIVAAHAGQVLVAIHRPVAWSLLLELLRHDRPLVRLTAVRAVQAWNDPQQAAVLYPSLNDPDTPTAAAAAAALGALGNTAADEPLLVRLREQPPAVVAERIAWALGELRSRAAVDDLAALVGNDPDHVSAAAAEALGKIGDPAAIPALRGPVANVKPPMVASRRESLKALRLLGDTDTKAAAWRIIAQKIIPTPMGPVFDASEVREEALRYFAAAGDQRVAKSLLDLLDGSDPMTLAGILGETFRTLAALGDADTGRQILARLQMTPEPDERVVLVEVLRQLTGWEYRALPNQDHLRYSVESLGPPPFLRTPEPPGVVPVN